MATSFKRNLIAAALLATTFASAGAEARPRGAGRGPQPPSGPGRLRNVAQAMCLDVAGWAAQGNSDVLLWECNDDPDHVWSFTRSGELRNGLNGTCLDAAGYAGEQGANVDVYRCESLDDQRWKIVPRGHGTFELRNVKRDLCLDVNGRSGARGDDVLLWACDGGVDQLWTFEAYTPPPPTVPQLPLPRRYRPSDPPPPMPELQVPPAPHERAQQGPRPMEEGSFRSLIAAVRNQSFSDSQLAVIQQAATRNYFRVGQVVDLIELVAFSASKLRVLELGAPRVVDPENAFAVYDAFAFSADKAQARQILRRNGF